jgi:transcriptional regulator with XRE-family HTH domain
MGTKFKELMKENGFTQTKLSQISGVAQSNLSIYCNYINTLEASTMVTRMRLSKAFNMSVKEFDRYLNLAPGNYTLNEVE